MKSTNSDPNDLLMACAKIHELVADAMHGRHGRTRKEKKPSIK